VLYIITLLDIVLLKLENSIDYPIILPTPMEREGRVYFSDFF
jgi:hypothetical protein